MTKYYEISLYLDEMQRSKKKGFYPLVVKFSGTKSEAENMSSGTILPEDRACHFTVVQNGVPNKRLSNDANILIFENGITKELMQKKLCEAQLIPCTYDSEFNNCYNYGNALNIISKIQCMDMINSEYSVFGAEYPHPNPEYMGKVRVIDSLVIDTSKIDPEVHLFRLYEKPNRLIADDVARLFFESMMCDNISFVPLKCS